MRQVGSFRMLTSLILVIAMIAILLDIPSQAIAATRHPVIPANGQPILGGNMHGSDWISRRDRPNPVR
jgi:hypothetical protein